MKADFIGAMRLKTDEELQQYIEERWKHEADAVLAAVDVLLERGYTIDHDDLVQLKRDLGVDGFWLTYNPNRPPSFELPKNPE